MKIEREDYYENPQKYKNWDYKAVSEGFTFKKVFLILIVIAAITFGIVVLINVAKLGELFLKEYSRDFLKSFGELILFGLKVLEAIVLLVFASFGFLLVKQKLFEIEVKERRIIEKYFGEKKLVSVQDGGKLEKESTLGEELGLEFEPENEFNDIGSLGYKFQRNEKGGFDKVPLNESRDFSDIEIQKTLFHWERLQNEGNLSGNQLALAVYGNKSGLNTRKLREILRGQGREPGF